MSSMVEIANRIDNIGLLHEKSNQRGWWYTFLKTFMEFLDLSIYPKKFQGKQAFTPENTSKLCGFWPWKFQGQKPRPIEIT